MGNENGCGPGVQQQKRNCTNGTGIEICTPEDAMQIISCKQAGTDLPHCPKVLGKWIIDGACNATGNIPSCGPGMQKLTRTCKDGTGSEICSINDKTMNVPCSQVGTDLRNCPKIYSRWINSGPCKADDGTKVCGPGMQKQIRNCTDGTGTEICNDNDKYQYISCKSAGTDLPDCPKMFGKWRNKGPCYSNKDTQGCGPGIQMQTRECWSGSGNSICEDNDKRQNISCEDAGTSLPNCAKTFGIWVNIGPCIPAASNSSCGTGIQRQIRQCIHGTGPNLCTLEDQERSLPCEETDTMLPQCAKIFGNWLNIGDCIPKNTIKSCGPGTQKQERGCGNGTGSEICNITDTKREISCIEAGTALADCPKIFGLWKNVGPCISKDTKLHCGGGVQRQERSCENGTGNETCDDGERSQIISCKEAGTDLPECPKIFTKWKNSGPCLPIASITDCGPGIQVQERTCINGTNALVCTDEDMIQTISCKAAGTDLPDCPKRFGEWVNIGECITENKDMLCGPGFQQQKRTCVSGTGSEICSEQDLTQNITCEKAGVQMPDCPKKLGKWQNDGPCISTGISPICGPGVQKQMRSCINGTGSECCMLEDTTQTLSCTEAGTALPDCPKKFGEWVNDGHCIALGDNPFCGPGLQSQQRSCESGTGNQICNKSDRERQVRCADVGTSLPKCTGIRP